MNEAIRFSADTIAWDFDWLLSVLKRGDSDKDQKAIVVVFTLLAELGIPYRVCRQNNIISLEEIKHLKESLKKLQIKNNNIQVAKPETVIPINARSFKLRRNQFFANLNNSGKLKSVLLNMYRQDTEKSEKLVRLMEEVKGVSAEKPKVISPPPLEPSPSIIRHRSFFENLNQIKKSSGQVSLDKPLESFLNSDDTDKIKDRHQKRLKQIFEHGGLACALSSGIETILDEKRYFIIPAEGDLVSKVTVLKSGRKLYIEEEVTLFNVRHLDPEKEIKAKEGAALMQGVCRYELELKENGKIGCTLTDVVLDYKDERTQKILDKRGFLEKIKDYIKSFLGLNEFKKIDEKLSEHEKKIKISTELSNAYSEPLYGDAAGSKLIS